MRVANQGSTHRVDNAPRDWRHGACERAVPESEQPLRRRGGRYRRRRRLGRQWRRRRRRLATACRAAARRAAARARRERFHRRSVDFPVDGVGVPVAEEAQRPCARFLRLCGACVVHEQRGRRRGPVPAIRCNRKRSSSANVIGQHQLALLIVGIIRNHRRGGRTPSACPCARGHS